MKTTLNINDELMRELKATAAARGETMSHLVESALWRYLKPEQKHPRLKPLPTFDGGECFVDIADRETLYEAMEE